jgi:hypothetical protein
MRSLNWVFICYSSRLIASKSFQPTSASGLNLYSEGHFRRVIPKA